jgi:hypothetical protein
MIQLAEKQKAEGRREKGRGDESGGRRRTPNASRGMERQQKVISDQ